ncbi:hypothetical protein PsorP6_015418 [Peronosclerospora sorghi]|uniref:Uncharacterized protein n=1 Tax=Peronosclerospora sorghi TaxID=230839 RepID=A0ACC0WR73_9STRA|nr:hypothetical protein PsorP6_015418 [Peronosclerospora sorghi]
MVPTEGCGTAALLSSFRKCDVARCHKSLKVCTGFTQEVRKQFGSSHVQPPFMRKAVSLASEHYIVELSGTTNLDLRRDDCAAKRRISSCGFYGLEDS